jgi:hypothetical protein
VLCLVVLEVVVDRDLNHLGVLSALGESALTIAEATSLHAPEADSLLEALRTQAATAAAVAAAHCASLEATGKAVAGLAPMAETAHSRIVEHASQLEASAAESCRVATQTSSDMASEASTALTSAMDALTAQRTAFSKADTAREERWLQLERTHGDVLRAVEAVAGNAHAENKGLVARGDTSAQEKRADEAQQHVAMELKEHRQQLAVALAEHQHLWLAGLSEKPMLAFTDELIFEDNLAHAVAPETAPLPPQIVEELATQRASEKALSTEFFATRGPSNLHKEGKTTFDIIQASERRTAPLGGC